MRDKIQFVAAVIFGLVMVNSGLNKFFNYMPMPEISPEMMNVVMALVATKWIIPLVGIAEVIGGVLVVIRKSRALGAIVIFPVMIGILVHHLTHDVAGIGLSIILFAINIWLIIEHRARYFPMINELPQQSERDQVTHRTDGVRPGPAIKNA